MTEIKHPEPLAGGIGAGTHVQAGQQFLTRNHLVSQQSFNLARRIKRHRSTKAEVEQRREDLFKIVTAMNRGYTAEASERSIVRELVRGIAA